MGGRIGRLVEIDYSTANIVLDRTLERRAAIGERGVMTRANIELVIILTEKVMRFKRSICNHK